MQIDGKHKSAATGQSIKLKTDSAPTAKADSTPISMKFSAPTDAVGDTIEKNKAKKVPPELDKQLDIIYKNGIADLANMPKWLKALGGNKVKTDFVKIVESDKFKKEMTQIMTEAKAKSKKPNKDVTELLKEPGTINKVFECLKNNTEKFTLLRFIIDSSLVKEKFSSNIYNNQHKYLLYGE